MKVNKQGKLIQLYSNRTLDEDFPLYHFDFQKPKNAWDRIIMSLQIIDKEGLDTINNSSVSKHSGVAKETVLTHWNDALIFYGELKESVRSCGYRKIK